MGTFFREPVTLYAVILRSPPIIVFFGLFSVIRGLQSMYTTL